MREAVARTIERGRRRTFRSPTLICVIGPRPETHLSHHHERIKSVGCHQVANTNKFVTGGPFLPSTLLADQAAKWSKEYANFGIFLRDRLGDFRSLAQVGRRQSRS